MKEKVTETQRVLNIWAIVVIIWSFYRTKWVLPEWFDEFVAKPLVFLVPVIWYIKKYEGVFRLKAIGFDRTKISKDLTFAFIIGILFTLGGLMANMVKNHGLRFNSTLFTMHSQGLLYVCMVAVATAVTEEILTRGFLMKRLYGASKRLYLSAFQTSALFVVLHIPILFTNYKLSGPAIVLFLLTDFILSMINSLVFVESGNILAPILIHFFYNMAIILYS